MNKNNEEFIKTLFSFCCKQIDNLQKEDQKEDQKEAYRMMIELLNYNLAHHEAVQGVTNE